MRARRFLALVGWMVLAPALAWAGQDAGTDPGLYLGTGAAAVGTGRTGVAGLGVAAADWNPAGLAYTPRCEVLLQHAPLLGEANHDTLLLAVPVLDWGTWAAGWTRVELGGIDRRDAANLPGGTFGYREQQFTLSYGHAFWDVLALGATVKLHQLRLDGYESTAPGSDLGVLARFERPFAAPEAAGRDLVQMISLGASVRNAAAPALKLKDEIDRLHPTYRLGASLGLALFESIPDCLTLSADAEKPEQAAWRLHAGAEYSLLDHFALRGGWDAEYFSAGAGAAFGGASLDYAVSFPATGMRHLVSVSWAFGDNLRDIQARRKAEEERQRLAVVDKLKNEIIAGYDQQAKELAAAGKYAEAVKLWEKVLDWDPDNPETQANLKVAREQLRLQEIAALLKAAQDFFDEERYVDTMLECRRVLEMDPGHADAQALYDKAEKKATTLGELAFAKEVKSLVRIRQHYLAGLKAYAAQNWEAAIKHWEQVIVDSPMQKQVYMYMDKAKAAAQKARQQRGEPEASPEEKKRMELYKKAVSLSQAGKLKDAALTWEKIITENPADTDAKSNLDKTRKEFIESEKRGIRW